MSYMHEPPLGSILYGRDIPDCGGDTLFTNMYMAYETLPEPLKEMIDGRSAFHSDRYLTARIDGRNEGAQRPLKEGDKENMELHRLVRRSEERRVWRECGGSCNASGELINITKKKT